MSSTRRNHIWNSPCGSKILFCVTNYKQLVTISILLSIHISCNDCYLFVIKTIDNTDFFEIYQLNTALQCVDNQIHSYSKVVLYENQSILCNGEIH